MAFASGDVSVMEISAAVIFCSLYSLIGGKQ